MSDIIISDEELQICSQEMKMFGENIRSMQSVLSVLLTSIAEVVFVEGNIATNLKYLCEQFTSLNEAIEFFVQEEQKYVNNMITEIDIADKDLYV